MTSHTKNIITFLRLRVLVGMLGEQQSDKWWSSSFFDQSSDAFLQPAFPRTTFLAKYHGIKEAAMRVHDEHIGVGQVFHLYRLPETIEKELHDLAQDADAIETVKTSLSDAAIALRSLESMIGAETWTGEGPVNAGTVDDITRKMAWQDVAFHYANAFKNETKTYPYFTSKA